MSVVGHIYSMPIVSGLGFPLLFILLAVIILGDPIFLIFDTVTAVGFDPRISSMPTTVIRMEAKKRNKCQ